MRAPRVVHITTVHRAIDPRIRLKQLRSLVTAGVEAHLVCADPHTPGVDDGVTVHVIGDGQRNRVRRMTVLTLIAVLRALALPARAYHFHDPEIALWAWLLHLRGVPVVYDVHEDFAKFMRHKPYLPAAVGRVLGAAVGFVEKILTAGCRVVIAEHCYRPRFPGAVAILNYPDGALIEKMNPARSYTGSSAHLLYTGNLTVARGADNLVKLVRELPSVEVTTVGECKEAVLLRLQRSLGSASSRFHIHGARRYVPFSEIAHHYAHGQWLAGAVLMPDSPHYRDKHLTKFFEFMAAGLPIIASDSPTWKTFVEGQGVGICVDPASQRAVHAATQRLLNQPELRLQMALRGQELIRSRYTWEHQVPRLLSLYSLSPDTAKAA